ncbi:MAG: radical SAM protein, partial [Mogibacterium sp.]|nr:radical SAM protein [Mogibacterium sp.]
MKWSRYNNLFQSQRNGWLLFNSASRNFLKVEDEELPIIQKIARDPEHADYSALPMLYMQLRSMGFLVEDSADDDLYNIIRMRALTELYAPGNLLLTIAVTRACNFDCSYCFEGNRTGKPMSQEVEDQLIKFIGRFYTPNVSLTWFGGEPLLAFDRILSIDRRIRDLGKRVSAAVITNGYLLDDYKVSKLNDLNVDYLQLTHDGKKATHDSRR